MGATLVFPPPPLIRSPQPKLKCRKPEGYSIETLVCLSEGILTSGFNLLSYRISKTHLILLLGQNILNGFFAKYD